MIDPYLQVKDYYQILNINTSASQQDIKKAFRQLALRYHPDKTNNDLLSAEKFKEIQEAYRTLSNEKSKKAYDTTKPKKPVFKPPPSKVSVSWILAQLQQVNRKAATFDPNRMDQHGLYQTIDKLLSSHNVVMLKEADDLAQNRLIVLEVFKLCSHLNFTLTERIIAKLNLFTHNDSYSVQNIQTYLKNKKRHSYWQKYKLLLAIVVSILLCMIIYHAST